VESQIWHRDQESTLSDTLLVKVPHLRGVTVPPVYINRARHFGFEGDPNQGRVTVGQILAAQVLGLDKADWQVVLAGHSRYDLLKDAIRQVQILW
jgi:hypothetical protein